MLNIKNWFIPNKLLSRSDNMILILIHITLFTFLWSYFANGLIPNPTEVISSLSNLVFEQGILLDMIESTKLCFLAIFYSVMASLTISYLSTLAFFKPIAMFASLFRFLAITGLSIIFTMLTSGGYSLKISILMFCMSGFFITSMMSVIDSISKNEYNHVRTLGFSEWRVTYELIILSRLDQMYECVRQNFAIAWTMVTTVETLSRIDGGVGAMLADNNKVLNLSAVFAIQILILLFAMLQNMSLVLMKKVIFPYSNLTTKK